MSRWRRFMRWSGIGCWTCGGWPRFGYGPFCEPCKTAEFERIAADWLRETRGPS